MTIRIRYSWKRHNPTTFGGQVIYSLRVNGKDPNPWLAKIQRSPGGGNRWFWYGSGRNTAQTPKPLDECKAEALAYVKSLTVTP